MKREGGSLGGSLLTHYASRIMYYASPPVITKELVRVFSDNISVLILVGGFGRGEGAVLVENGQRRNSSLDSRGDRVQIAPHARHSLRRG